MFKKPVMYLRDSIIFPRTEESSLLIGREDSIKAIDEAMTNHKNQICIITQMQGENEKPSDDEVFPVGTVCEIEKCLNFSDGTRKILIKGIKTFNLSKITYENETRFVEGEEFDWSATNEKLDEKAKVEVLNLLKKYNPDWSEGEGLERLNNLYNKVDDLDDFVLKTSKLLASPYMGVQKKEELEKIKRDLDYWKEMNEEHFTDMNSRIGKRMTLLTALPSLDKLKIIKDILHQESNANS